MGTPLPDRGTQIQGVRCAKQMLAMFEPQWPKRLTDVVTGDETFISLYVMPSKQANMVWIGEAVDRLQTWPDFTTRSGSSLYCSTMLDPRLSHYAREDNNDQQPLHRNSTDNSCCGCPRAATKRGNHRILYYLILEKFKWTLLLHDNAAPHKARATIQYLEGEKWQVLPHPPYSPDVTPCDFWLFYTVKTGLAGKIFFRIEDLAIAVNLQLDAIPTLE